MVGEKWAHVVRTPSDRKVVGAGPVGSGYGSYQLVSWWGGQCWWPPMAHAQWWQSGSAIRDVVTTNSNTPSRLRGYRLKLRRGLFGFPDREKLESATHPKSSVTSEIWMAAQAVVCVCLR